MKAPIICSALAILLIGGDSVTGTVAQDSDDNQRLAEMQATIDSLKAELDNLKNEQNSRPRDPLLVDPQAPVPYNAESVPERRPENRFRSRWQQSRTRPVPPQNHQPYPRDYPPADYPHAEPLFPVQPNVPPAVVERVYVPQPTPVFVEPHCVHGGYGYGDFPHGGFYYSPGGWGFGVGGLQFNFAGHGYGHHGRGHYRHKGHHHKHHKHDD